MLDFAQITHLATQAVAFLTPLLDKAADGAAEKLGETVFSTILNKLKAMLSSAATAQEALEDLRQQPTDADTQAALRKQLSKAMQSNPALAEQIQDWLAESQAKAAAIGIHQSATNQGDNNVSIQIAGNGNTVRCAGVGVRSEGQDCGSGPQ